MALKDILTFRYFINITSMCRCYRSQNIDVFQLNIDVFSSSMNIEHPYLKYKLSMVNSEANVENKHDKVLNTQKIFIMEKTEDAQVKVTISQPKKILHFSDGVDEEIEEEHVSVLDSKPPEPNADPKTLSWGPWFSYVAWKSGTKMLSAVDTAGESLANFFGITTPKYQLEIDEYERVKEEKQKLEEESAGWVPQSNGGDIPLVLNEPLKAGERN